MEKSFKAIAKRGSLQYFQDDLVKKWLSAREDKIIHVLMDDDFVATGFTKYYFAHVCDVIAKETSHTRYEVHKENKRMFLSQDMELLGEIYHDDVSFKDLFAQEREEFIHRVMAYWMERGLTFEDPEVFKIKKALK